MEHIPPSRQPFFFSTQNKQYVAQARPIFSEGISKIENRKTVVVQTKYDPPPVAKDAPKTSVTPPHLHTVERSHGDGAMRRAGGLGVSTMVYPGELDLKTKSKKTADGNGEKEVEIDTKQIFENRIEREWLTTNEAAHFLKISENALKIMVHRGQVSVFKFGRRLRFRFCDCQALIQKKGA